MAHCRNDSLILRSIEEIRTVQRKRPHRENILAFASKHFGLNLSDGEDSLDSLMKEGVVFNKPTSTGLPSLFIKEDIDNAEATAEISEETAESESVREEASILNSKDSFLCFLDGLTTPKKQTFEDCSRPQVEIVLPMLSKLIDNNAKLNELLVEERRKNISLVDENSSLKIQLHKIAHGINASSTRTKSVQHAPIENSTLDSHAKTKDKEPEANTKESERIDYQIN